MNNIIAPIITARNFTWDGNHGEAMASDLGFRAGELPYYRLFNDSIDVGLILNSPKTNRDEIFFYNEEKTCVTFGYSEEVVGWSFTTANGRYTLTVFND